MKFPSVYTDLCFKQVIQKCPPPAATHAASRLAAPVTAGSRSRSATWRHAVHRRAFTTFEINAPDSVTIDNRTHIDITFFILNIYEIISRNNVHKSWITLYIYVFICFILHLCSEVVSHRHRNGNVNMY